MTMSNPFSSFNIQDYSQHFAMYNKYAEMMKGINPAAAMNLLSQFGSVPSAPAKKATKSQSSKGKQAKSQSSRPGSSVPSTSKESVSIKPIQQHSSSTSQPKQRSQSASMQKSFSVTSMPKHSPGSTMTSSYSMVDLTKPMSSPFSIPSSTPPHLSPSPNKSPIMLNPSVTPPAAHQIRFVLINLKFSSLSNVWLFSSPTKTLQQKLAERQKALMDANARSGSSGN